MVKVSHAPFCQDLNKASKLQGGNGTFVFPLVAEPICCTFEILDRPGYRFAREPEGFVENSPFVLLLQRLQKDGNLSEDAKEAIYKAAAAKPVKEVFIFIF